MKALGFNEILRISRSLLTPDPPVPPGHPDDEDPPKPPSRP
jgi:hypothetical protein